jgi:hypothetical protein
LALRPVCPIFAEASVEFALSLGGAIAVELGRTLFALCALLGLGGTRSLPSASLA